MQSKSKNVYFYKCYIIIITIKQTNKSWSTNIANFDFSGHPVDQTIEHTVSRDTKTRGGIIGFSVNKGAVQRWLLTSYERAAITQACREMAGLQQIDGVTEKEIGNTRMTAGKKDVQKVLTTVNNWVNHLK